MVSVMTTPSDTTRPDCNIEVDRIEKTTVTGRDMSEYHVILSRLPALK